MSFQDGLEQSGDKCNLEMSKNKTWGCERKRKREKEREKRWKQIERVKDLKTKKKEVWVYVIEREREKKIEKLRERRSFFIEEWKCGGDKNEPWKCSLQSTAAAVVHDLVKLVSVKWLRGRKYDEVLQNRIILKKEKNSEKIVFKF